MCGVSYEDRTHTLSFTARSADHYTKDTKNNFGLGGQDRTAMTGFGDQRNAIIRHRDKPYGSTLPSRAMVTCMGATPTVYFHMVGDTGFEPVNVGFKIRCLRPAWLIPYMDTNC